MILGMTAYQIFWNFLLYSFFGWVVEVAFHAASQHRVINRGFLNGPVCPVYGAGIIAVFGAVNTAAAFSSGEKDLNIFLLFASVLGEKEQTIEVTIKVK